MTKNEMSQLLRSVGVNENTITAMENAWELGYEHGVKDGIAKDKAEIIEDLAGGWSMTQDEIIEMARHVDACYIPRYNIWQLDSESLEAFAKLVAAKAIDDYLDAEREAELKARGEA